MRQLLLWILAASTLASPVALSQVAPVRLKVTKNMRKDMEHQTHLVRETVSYAIEISHNAASPVEVAVRWAVLVTPGHRYDGALWRFAPQQILEGEHTCKIDRIQKCLFDTDEIELAAYTKKVSYSRYKSDIAAYYVEALVNGVVVASDIQPSNAKLRIQEEKAKRNSEKAKSGGN